MPFVKQGAVWILKIGAKLLKLSLKDFMLKESIRPWIIKLPGLASYLFYQYHCLRVNWVYAEIHTFLPPYSKRLFIAMIHRKVDQFTCISTRQSLGNNY